MWKKGSGKGYFNGTYVWDFEDRYKINLLYRSKARRFQDGRTEIILNLYSPFPTNEEKTKKAMSDYFKGRFGFPPKICVVVSGRKSKGCKGQYLTIVSWYAVFNDYPDLTGIMGDAEKLLVEVRFKRYAPDGSVEIFRYDEVSMKTMSVIKSACEKNGRYYGDKVIWRLC